jgi:hypothetical protein
MKSKKVLFIITSFEIGGIEKYLVRFLEKFKGKLEAVVVVKKYTINQKLYDRYKHVGADIKHIPLNLFGLRSNLKLFKLLKEERINSICDFSGNLGGYLLFIAKLAKIKKRIVFYRETRYQFQMSYLKYIYVLFMKFLLKKSATKFLSNSKEAFNNWHPKWKENKGLYKVIYNGIPFKKSLENRKIDFKGSHKISTNSFVIGHIGRFTDAKNHEMILEIAKHYINHKNICFLLIGKDVEIGLKQKILNNNLEKNIVIVSEVEDIFEIHKLMNIFLFPSKNEGQPNALLEAILSKIPILASDINSHKESLPKEYWNQLCSNNSSKNYINKIDRIFNGENLYSTENLEKWAKDKYNPDNRFLEFYNEL